MAAHRATGRAVNGAGRRFVESAIQARRQDPRVGRHRVMRRSATSGTPRVVPILAGLSVAAGIVLLVPAAQAADPPSQRPAVNAALAMAHSVSAADAQSGTGLVPLSTESAAATLAPSAAKPFAGDQARGMVAVQNVARPVHVPAASPIAEPANPLAFALLLIFGGGVVFAVSRARTVGGYRGGGQHL